MPADKQHLNWTDAQFTTDDTVPVVVAITGVQDVQFDYRTEIQSHSGDADSAPRVKVASYTDPVLTIRHRDIGASHDLPPDTRGEFEVTHLAAKQKGATGGGGYTISIASCVVGTNQFGGAHRQFGESTLTIEIESPDGVTVPITITAL